MSDMIKPGDPSWGVYQSVERWDALFDSLPTWDEMLEVEYIRQRGEINMLTQNVARWAHEHELFHAFVWL